MVVSCTTCSLQQRRTNVGAQRFVARFMDDGTVHLKNANCIRRSSHQNGTRQNHTRNALECLPIYLRFYRFNPAALPRILVPSEFPCLKPFLFPPALAFGSQYQQYGFIVFR